MKKVFSAFNLISMLALLTVTFNIVSRPTAVRSSTIVNTGDNFEFCEGTDCPEVSPANEPTPTDIVEPPIDFNDRFDPTPTTAPTATPEVSENDGNINVPCILGCPSPTVTPTTGVQVQPSPTPTTAPAIGGGSSSSSNSSSSEPAKGEILASNTIAPTGVFADTMANMILSAGLLSMALAGLRYVFEIR